VSAVQPYNTDLPSNVYLRCRYVALLDVLIVRLRRLLAAASVSILNANRYKAQKAMSKGIRIGIKDPDESAKDFIDACAVQPSARLAIHLDSTRHEIDRHGLIFSLDICSKY
jgi:hypothetical protein